MKETPVERVFRHWNRYYGKGNWKAHRTMSRATEQAIGHRLAQRYTADDLCAAIDNYATVLLNPQYKWTYAWTLLQFLVRHPKHRREEEQLWRWLPGEFHEGDYLRPEAVRFFKQKQPPPKPIVEATAEEKADFRQQVRELTGRAARSMKKGDPK